MKIALAQFKSHVGNLAFHKQQIIEQAQKAKQAGAALVLFSELSLCGYPPQDLLERKSFLQACQKSLQEIAKQCSGIAIVLGAPIQNPSAEGKRLFNAALLIQNQKIQVIHRKNFIPNYDVFSEARYFEPANDAGMIRLNGICLGVSICEDVWNEKNESGNKLYLGKSIFQRQKEQGAQLLLNLSASPYSSTKVKKRQSLFSKLCKQFKLPLLYVNSVGSEDDLIFDGRSFVMDEKGKLKGELPAYETGLAYLEFNPQKKSLRPLKGFTKNKDNRSQAIVFALKEYLRKTNYTKVVLGLSGGIDSAVVAAMAVQAVGPKNVLAVALPSPYNSPQSLKDAQVIAKNLKIELRVIEITKLYENFQNELGWDPSKSKVDLALQNIQSRLRGNLLMALSNREGCLLLSTGNKSEYAMGYGTLYGDMAGGLAPLGDLTKAQVYQVGRELNQIQKAIPSSVFKKAPSAELAPGQKDEDDLPPYDILDKIIVAHVEECLDEKEIVALGFEKKLVKQVLSRIHRNEYKRRQAPLIFRVSEKAFGSGRRFSQTHPFYYEK